MHKLKLFFLVLASAPLIASAQGTEGQTVVITEEGDNGSLILSVAGAAGEIRTAEGDRLGSGTFSYGLGALVEANIYERLGIEVGAIYLGRQYSRNFGESRLVQEVNRLHLPVLARLWIGNYVTLGAGAYAAFKVGGVDDTISLQDPNLVNAETDADDSLEYGLNAALAGNFAVTEKTGVFLEGRYFLPMSTNDDEANEIVALAGVKMDL